MPGRCAQMCGNQCQSQSPLDDKQCRRTKAGVEEGCSGVAWTSSHFSKQGSFIRGKTKDSCLGLMTMCHQRDGVLDMLWEPQKTKESRGWPEGAKDVQEGGL